MRPTVAAHVLALLCLAAAIGACSGDDSAGGGSTASLAGGCNINSDCTEPLVCAFRKCHTACESSRDCPGGQRCMASDRPFHVCQLPDEQKCAYNSQCPAGQLCGVDGQCRDQCAADLDCVEGQLCTQGTCAEPAELQEGRLPHTKDAGGDATGQPCSYTSECASPLVCLGGLCKLECLGDVDCNGGAHCEDHRCVSAAPPDASTLPVPDGAPDGFGNACAYSVDCAPPLVCRANACVLDCITSDDCAAGQECTGNRCKLADTGSADGGAPDVSVPPDAPDGYGSACSYNSDCASPLLCRAGACVYECNANVDCPVGKECNAHRCAIPSLPDGAPDGYGKPCNLTSDCQPSLVCSAIGQCVYECVTDFDCASGRCCLPATHHCVVDIGGTCGSPMTDAGLDAPGDAKGCTTDLDCDDGLFCTGVQVCVSGVCKLAGKADACDDGNPCTTDSCDEGAKSCSHAASGPVDQDGDGHYAKACGGTADDCDDKNPNAYPGHPEICDGEDDNCDGQVDEGLWNAGPIVHLTGTTDAGAPFGTQTGAPAIVRLADGTFVVVATASPTALGCTPASAQMHAIHLGATLAPIGSTVLDTLGGSGPMLLWPSLASDGQGIAAGFVSTVYCTGTTAGRLALSKGDLSNPTVQTMASSPGGYPWTYVSAVPALAYNGQSFLAAWADTHATGSSSFAQVYVAAVGSAGTLSNVHTPTGTLTDAQVATLNDGSRLTLAVGSSSALLAFRAYSDATVHYWVLDENLNATLTPMVTLTGTDAARVMGGAHAGASFALATQSTNGDAVRVRRIDATTGSELASVALTNPAGGIDPRLDSDSALAAVGKGFGLTMSRGPNVAFGWAREDLAGGFVLTEIYTGSSTSARIAPIDDTHVAMVWQDGGVKGTILKCGP